MGIGQALARTRRELARTGLLMQHDARWPSVTTIVAGAPVRGSWWSHARGREIFAVLQALEPEVALVKLIGRKVTLVHRCLWPAVVAIGTSRQPWQLDGLPPDAAAGLAHVEARGRVLATDLSDAAPRSIAKVVTDLEHRLLVHTEQAHTPSGKHVRVLTSWRAWASAHDLTAALPPIDAALRAIAAAVVEWPGADGVLPWSASRRARSK